MNKKKRIGEWLNTGNYKQGIALLEEFDPSNQFLRVLKKGANPYNKGKLRLQLRDILGSSRTPTRDNGTPEGMVSYAIPRPVAPTGDPPPKDRLYPHAVAKAIQKRAKVVNARNKLSNSLEDLPTREQRAQAIEEIGICQEEIKALGDFIGNWERTGQVGEINRKLTITEREKMVREYKNLMTKRSLAANNVRRWRKKKVKNEKVREGQIEHYKQVQKELDDQVKKYREILKAGEIHE